MSEALVKQTREHKQTRSRNGLIIFLRVGQLGKVKTRLAKTLGNIEALRIYQELVKITLDQARQVACTTYLYFSPKIDPSFKNHPDDLILCEQHGADLGQKMKLAFDEVLKHHEKAVIIGTDCPHISAEIITEAFNKLDKFDVTIGPAVDGGYYLLGLKKNQNQLFSEIEWSTSTVLSKTLENINLLQWSTGLLPTLSDIDHQDDWLRYLEESKL